MFAPRRHLKDLFDRRKSKDRIFAADLFRCTGFVLVLLFHCALSWWREVRYKTGESGDIYNKLNVSILLHGDLGLDIFFVVSGFLVGIGILRDGVPPTLNIEDAGKRYATFLEKRLIRLFPAYFSLLMLLAMLPDDISQCTILHGPVLFLGHFLVPTEPCADHTWTLSTFLHLYAMTPPLIWGMWKCATEFVPVRYRSRVMVVCLVSLSLIISFVQEIYLLENPNEWIFSGVLLSFYMNPLTRCPPYLCGIAVAFVEYTKNDDIKDVNEEDKDESEPLLESSKSKMITRKRRRYCSTSVRVFSLLLSILTILVILVIGPGTRRSFGSKPISEIDMGVGTCCSCCSNVSKHQSIFQTFPNRYRRGMESRGVVQSYFLRNRNFVSFVRHNQFQGVLRKQVLVSVYS